MSAAATRYVPSTSSVRYWLHYAAFHAEQGELDEADRCARRAGEIAAAAWSYAVDCVAPDYRLGA